MKKKRWYDWLWTALVIFLALSLYNALFAWLALLFMALPLLFTLFGGDKAFCNRYCPRGQFYQVIGGRLKATRGRAPPAFFRARWFRYLIVGLIAIKFSFVLYGALTVTAESSPYAGRSLSIFMDKPWEAGDSWLSSPGSVCFAFSMADFMLWLTAAGLIIMFLFRPRTWCVVCPMGTVTQAMCQLRHGWEQ